MDQKRLALKEYVELVMKAHKLEEEMLGIPKSAAKGSKVRVDLLFTSKDKPKLLKKFEELRDIESERDKARKKFIDML